MQRPPVILITAVEPSADRLGARLIEALRLRLPGVRFVGVGGPEMAAQGLASAFDPAELAILGFFDAALRYPRVLARVREVAVLAQRERPDAAILIDAWGFSLRAARALRRVDPMMRIIKYVGPQIWATRPGRARTLAAAVDHLLTIHAFDAPLFEAAGLPTTFVGNPTLASTPATSAAPREPATLLVLPGSRSAEVRRLLPPFGEAVGKLRRSIPHLGVLVGAAESVEGEVRAGVERWNTPATIIVGEAARLDAMRRATAALACSGTVTTELALAGCPMVVGYRLGPLTFQVAKRLIRTPWITLINIAAGREIAPEFIQGDCTGARLAQALEALFSDPERAARQAADQSGALETMRGGVVDPVGSAADAVVRLLQPRFSTAT